MERKDIVLDSFDPARIRRTAALPIITIYKHPEDYPQEFVARLWDATTPTRHIVKAATLEDVRKAVPADMARFKKDARDDPCIVESYL